MNWMIVKFEPGTRFDRYHHPAGSTPVGGEWNPVSRGTSGTATGAPVGILTILVGSARLDTIVADRGRRPRGSWPRRPPPRSARPRR